MTELDLKKLNRAELLEMLVAESKENERLRAQNENLQRQLNDRSIAVDEAGSIAEASLRLNGVFEAAQAAAEQYLENLRVQDENCQKIQQEAEAAAARTTAQAEARAASLLAEAEEKAESYWKLISQRLEAFYQEHQGLQELLQVHMKNE